jgi:hypothetical protein
MYCCRSENFSAPGRPSQGGIPATSQFSHIMVGMDESQVQNSSKSENIRIFGMLALEKIAGWLGRGREHKRVINLIRTSGIDALLSPDDN